MTTKSMIRASALGALLGVFAACSSGDSGGGGAAKDAGSDGQGAGSGGAGGAGTGGATGTPFPGAHCGSLTCGVVNDTAGVQSKACCTDTNECGVQTVLSPKCLSTKEPGGPSPACATFDIPGKITMPGCCGPQGCGALATFGDLGCIPNADLGRAAVACNYDPNNTCTSVVGVPCDGPEDCAGGKLCCGRSDGGAYTAFGCFDSCSALGADAGGGTWLELCHADTKCEDPTLSCSPSRLLPPSLARCFTNAAAAPSGQSSAAGEVNCGTGVCGAGEKCCLRPPKEPYCSKASEPCECTPPPRSDAGSPSTDGGGGSPGDASADAVAPADAATKG